MEKKKFLIIIFIIPLIAVFSISYYLTLNKYNTNIEKKKYELVNPGEKLQAVVLNNPKEEVINEKTEIIKKNRYLNSGEEQMVDKTIAGVELAGKTRKEIETIYGEGGYVVNEFSPEKIVLIKKINSSSDDEPPVFMPNKYVIWIKNENLAIYKTDENGIAYIENEETDVTDKKATRLRSNELKSIKNGSQEYQFNTREEAEAALGELTT